MSSTRAYRAILVATPLALLSACGSSEADANGPAANRIVGTPETDAEKLARAGDNDWINISGQVISAGPRCFVVAHGRGISPPGGAETRNPRTCSTTASFGYAPARRSDRGSS